jgi:hypothetical protein
MSQRNEKPDYLLLFRGNTWERTLSPAELKQVVTAWSAWYQQLAVAGYFQLRVANGAEAMQIAQQCPRLNYAGCIVEVRPVGEQNVARVAGLEYLEKIAKAVTTKA